MKTQIKKLAAFFIPVLLISITVACSDDTEDAIDCIVEESKMRVDHSFDSANSHIVNFTAVYTGNYGIDKVEWTFGDGQTETVLEYDKVSHTYDAPGTYFAKAKIFISDNGNSCDATIDEELHVID